MNETSTSSTSKSWIAAIACYSFWGFMPLYWRLFEGTPAFVIFVHRTLWSFPFLFAMSYTPYFRRQQKFNFNLKTFPWLALAGLMIGANWWIYIYGVGAHKVLEMSLGYFLSPLLSSALGVVFLKERLCKNQWIGVGLVTCGVAFYSLHVGYIPLMAIGLATTFSAYSIIRKVVNVPPMTALTTETLVLFVLASIYLLIAGRSAAFQNAWDTHSLLLILGGTMTAIPLLWFAVAVKGLSMTTMGMLNYISPTGKFLIAVLIFNEDITLLDLGAFVLIWSGVYVYIRPYFQTT